MRAWQQFWSRRTQEQRRAVLAAVMAGTVASGVSLGIAASGHGADGAAAQARKVAAWLDPEAVFAARSPGARARGALFLLKHRRAAAVRHHGHRRERAAAFPPAPELPQAEPEAPVFVFVAAPLALADTVVFAPPFTLPEETRAEPVGLPYTLGTAPREPDQIGPTRPPAVPEAPTWLMAMLGVGIAGIALRRSRRPRQRP